MRLWKCDICGKEQPSPPCRLGLLLAEGKKHSYRWFGHCCKDCFDKLCEQMKEYVGVGDSNEGEDSS